MKKYIIIAITSFALCSCKKQEQWLNVKSNNADIVPVTLADFQSILDNDAVMNANYPGLGLLGSDNYYITYTYFQSAQTMERNAYTWAPDIYEGGPSLDWQYQYTRVEYANIALDGISNIPETASNKEDRDGVKGSALFFRGFSFYNLLQLFTVPYDPARASALPGIPLRLSSDINIKSSRSTLAQSYEQVIKDLSAAKELLPDKGVSPLNPSKAACLTLLARVSLIMEDWPDAVSYTTDALAIQNELIDFNSLDTTASATFAVFPPGNPEIIFFAASIPYFTLSRSNLKADTELYRSYAPGDLRRPAFYKDNGSNGFSYKGNYTGKNLSSKFTGLATNELYLIRAEAYARTGNITGGLADLNTLLEKRWLAGMFIPRSDPDASSLLNDIITERRKELPFTGSLRWEDLRRLGRESLLSKTLMRNLNGVIYTLPPGDNRYVYPIPDNEIQLSGIEQNPR